MHYNRIEPEEHADLRLISPAFDTKAGYSYDARDREDNSGGVLWLLFALAVMPFAGLIAWGIHAAIANAGSLPAYCATLECAVARGL